MQKSRDGYGKNWMHFVYKMDNLFRSIRISDENSSVTKAFHFLNNLRITKLNIMIKHTNIKHKKKESLKNLFSKLSYSQTSDSHKFQIIQNSNYSNLKTTGTNRKFLIFVPKAKNIHKETLNTAKNNSEINKRR